MLHSMHWARAASHVYSNVYWECSFTMTKMSNRSLIYSLVFLFSLGMWHCQVACGSNESFPFAWNVISVPCLVHRFRGILKINKPVQVMLCIISSPISFHRQFSSEGVKNHFIPVFLQIILNFSHKLLILLNFAIFLPPG